MQNLTGIVSGSSAAFESLESIFHQDLNRDGTIGVVTTVIQTDGSTSLTEVGDNYFLYNSGTGPELKYSGGAGIAGPVGPWLVKGREKSTAGTEGGWTMRRGAQYQVSGTASKRN